MKAVLWDVWHDLVRKRLLPVAAGLLVAIVVVPVLLLRGSNAASDAAPVASVAGSGVPAPARGDVRLASGIDPSDLSAFDRRDPFEPRGGARRSGAAAPLPGEGTAILPGEITGAGAATSGEAPSVGGGSAPTPPARNDTGEQDQADRTPSDDGNEAEPEQPTTLTRTVDVKVGTPGEEVARNDVATLSLLPSESDPRFVFLGTTLTGKTAIFLVDAALQATHQGDGECRPSPSQCAFLYLRPENGRRRAVFTLQPDNDYFTEERQIALELVSITTQPLARVQKREQTRRRRARAANRRARPAYRPFVAPLFR